MANKPKPPKFTEDVSDLNLENQAENLAPPQDPAATQSVSVKSGGSPAEQKGAAKPTGGKKPGIQKPGFTKQVGDLKLED